MSLRTIKYKVEQDRLYRTYLKVINGILKVPLTDTEIDILEMIYKNDNRLDKDYRKVIQKQLGISEKNLNNYKSKLVKKQTLVDHTDYSSIHTSFLLPVMDGNSIIVALNFIVETPKVEKKEDLVIKEKQ